MELAFEIKVIADTERYDPMDQRWQQQVRELFAALIKSGIGASIQRTPVATTKGAVDTLIIALSSTGTLTAALGFFKAWLGRDKTRRLVISWTRDGKEEQVILEGTSLEAGTLQQVGEALLTRVGDEP